MIALAAMGIHSPQAWCSPVKLPSRVAGIMTGCMFVAQHDCTALHMCPTAYYCKEEAVFAQYSAFRMCYYYLY